MAMCHLRYKELSGGKERHQREQKEELDKRLKKMLGVERERCVKDLKEEVGVNKKKRGIDVKRLRRRLRRYK